MGAKSCLIHIKRFKRAINKPIVITPTVPFKNASHSIISLNGFTFDIAGFYNRLDHYIFIAPSADATTEGNKIYKYQQSNAGLFGFEAGFHIHPKQFDLMHFETTFSNVIGKKENGEYLPFIPANKLQSELRFENGKIGFIKDAFFKSLFCKCI